MEYLRALTSSGSTGGHGGDAKTIISPNYPLTYINLYITRQSEMADLAPPRHQVGWDMSHGNVHVKFHDDRLRNGGDITY